MICCVDLKPTMTDLTVRTSLTIDTNVHVGKSLSMLKKRKKKNEKKKSKKMKKTKKNNPCSHFIDNNFL